MTTQTTSMPNLGALTHEQLIALLGDKFTIAPKIDENQITITETEFKGKPMLSILKGPASFVNRPMQLSKKKAQLIVETYKAIKRFAELP